MRFVALGLRPARTMLLQQRARCAVLGGCLPPARRFALSRIDHSFSPSEMARTATTLAAAAPASASASAAEPESYESALSELDRLVQQMEGGQMPLDQLLAAYRRGADLLGFCRQRLQSVEEQVKVLEDGQLNTWGGS